MVSTDKNLFIVEHYLRDIKVKVSKECSNNTNKTFTSFLLLNLLGWCWLIQFYRFQVCNSIIHHLCIVFTTPSQVSFEQRLIPLSPLLPAPSPPIPLVITIHFHSCSSSQEENLSTGINWSLVIQTYCRKKNFAYNSVSWSLFTTKKSKTVSKFWDKLLRLVLAFKLFTLFLLHLQSLVWLLPISVLTSLK